MKHISKLKEETGLKICGIYCIQFNDYKYIGSSKCIGKRLKGHLVDLLSNKHHNQTMQRLFDKYGIDNMTYDVVEICDENFLLEREKYHIELLKRPYRINHILDPVEIKRSEIYKERLSIGAKNSFKKGRKIYNQKETYMYSLEGMYIKSFENATKAAEYFGDKNNYSVICSAARGDNYTAYNYRWSYFKVDKLNKLNKKYKLRPVLQIDLSNATIKEWESITEAQKTLNIKNITRAIKNNLTAGGFKWKYK
jgi:group I intron endonuclease